MFESKRPANRRFAGLFSERNNNGFTLIEVIAVLVILGVLAAVAIPKFYDIQIQAARRAALGGIAAARSACSMAYAHLVFENATNATYESILTLVQDDGPDGFMPSANEMTIEFSGEGPITITIVTRGETVTGTWTLP